MRRDNDDDSGGGDCYFYGVADASFWRDKLGYFSWGRIRVEGLLQLDGRKK